MAATRPNLILDPSKWYNIFDAPDLEVGDKLVITNAGNSTVKFTESASIPIAEGWQPIMPGKVYSNETGNIGGFVFASDGGNIQIEKSG